MTMPSFTLRKNERGELVLTDDQGQEITGVVPVRAFPLTDPLHSISLCDSQGREVFYLESLDQGEATRTLLEAELAQREFVPVIRRVLNTPPHTEPSTWQVETDRGVTTFELESEDSIHRRDPHRVSIVDSRGIRYEVEDTRKLDAHSRRVLDRFL